MSQPPDTVLNGSSSENNVPLKDVHVIQEMTKTQQHDPQLQQFVAAGNQQRPPLSRIDSRTSFPIRPGFPTNNSGQFRPPPQQQLRQLQPGQQFIQRGFASAQPRGQFVAQNQQIRPNFRPPAPFPRPPPPGSRPPGIFHQRSVPSFGQLQRLPLEGERIVRSHTLESTEIDCKTNEEKMNVVQQNRSSYGSSSNISDQQNNDERRQSVSSIGSLDEKRSGSVENLDKKPEDYPSRPESRANSRMDRIVEHDDRRPEIQPKTLPSPKKPPNPEIATVETTNKVDDKPMEKPKIINFDTKSLEDSPKIKTEGDNDSGVDESTQGNDQTSNHNSPRKPTTTKPPSRTSSITPTKNRSLSRGSKSPSLKSPDSNASTPGASEKKKLPMNKIQVGSAPSPNLKEVKSKIGSLQNTSYKPGGGHVKIETKKLDFKNAAPRIEAKNEKYTPKGGDKKIQQQKLQWNAKPKIGSLENASHKPKGGDKKIETVKLDFKDKAKPKVGSKDNIKHVPGGGDVKSDDEDKKGIETKKIELNVQSKIGSLDNVKHKPGGGEKRIFDDKDYLKQQQQQQQQQHSLTSTANHSLSGSQNSLPSQPEVRGPVADENLNQEH